MSNPPCFKHSSVLPNILWSFSHLIKWCHLQHASDHPSLMSFMENLHLVYLYCVCSTQGTQSVTVNVKVAQSSDSLQPRGLYSPRNSLGQNTGGGSLSLLQGIFPTQGSNQGHLHYRWILYQLSYWESPRYSKWPQSWPLWPSLLPYIMPSMSLCLMELLLKDPIWLIVLDQYLLSSYDVADVW